MTKPITFVRDGRRFSAHVAAYPPVPSKDLPSAAWWFVSIDEGPDLRVMEAYPEDEPGEELYERLAAGAAKADSGGT